MDMAYYAGRTLPSCVHSQENLHSQNVLTFWLSFLRPSCSWGLGCLSLWVHGIWNPVTSQSLSSEVVLLLHTPHKGMKRKDFVLWKSLYILNGKVP